MAVPLYRQKLSKTKYIWEIRELSIRIGKILANTSKKHRNLYSDKMQSLVIDALNATLHANEIRVKTFKDFCDRRGFLLQAQGDLWSLEVLSDIFLEQIKSSPIDPERKSRRDEKIEKQQIEIGGRILECTSLIGGVLDSDLDRYPDFQEFIV